MFFSACKRILIAICFLGVFVSQQAVSAAEAAATVSFDVVDGEVRDVLAALARLGGANLIADDSVQGKITIQIHSLDFYTALDLIAKTKGLTYQRVDGVIVMGEAAGIHKSFGRMHVMKLNFADPQAAVAAATLALCESDSHIAESEKKNSNIHAVNTEKSSKIDYNDKIDGLSSKRFAIDEATHSLLFYGTSSEAEMIRALLEQIDLPYQQVSLEAKVVAIDKTAAKNLGVEWEWSKLPQYPERETHLEAVTRTIVGADGNTHTVTEQRPKETITRTWQGGAGAAGIISFGRGPEGNPFEAYYTAQLNALITNGKASVLARPNITTIDGKEAVINIGGEVPVPTVAVTNATTTTSIVYRQAGIILKYTPRINQAGFITADVDTEVSSPVYIPEVKAYRFNKRAAHTTVRLKDGETMVIGGLIGSEESRSVSKIPFLGDLPILGRFFSNSQSSRSESEIMIFLTAHIVK